jgi:hypothetical protein
MSNVLEQKEVTVGGKLYILTAFPATLGLEIQMDLMNLQAQGIQVSASVVEKAITNGASLASAKITKALMDKHFARKYGEMMELFTAIIEFNFGAGEEGPNDQSDTSDQ